MTRINAGIEVEFLSDQHLLAEHREIKRIPRTNFKNKPSYKFTLGEGAVSAEKGEKLLIPINMRDGSLLCIGKGNEDWNFSAPHGAGRLFSRSKAKSLIGMDEFTASMEGIYTSSVVKETLDEAPQAYKNIDEIKNAITDTAEIIDILKTVYNYKSH